MRAYRKDGKLIIEIEETNIESGLYLSPGNEMGKIFDREKFFNFLADRICEFGEDGDFNSCSKMTRLIDDIITEAIESDEGIEC